MPSVKEEARAILSAYHRDRSDLIPVLMQFQKRFGYLPEEALAEAARHLMVSEGSVYSVATFYALFSLKPRGKHVVSVCQGTSCFVRGADRLLTRLKEELGIEVGDATPDKNFSLEIVRCVGCCALAPVLTVGERVHARVQTKDVPGLVKGYRDGE
jgi:NADH-quinone oxidoreductase subunit E/NADP-reducing hydrogenase subunit HndA